MIKKIILTSAIVYVDDENENRIVHLKYRPMMPGKLQPGRNFYEGLVNVYDILEDLDEEDYELLSKHCPEELL
jgi:hypothetical protein